MKVTNRRIMETVAAISQISLKKSFKGSLALTHNQRLFKPIVDETLSPTIIKLRDEVFGNCSTATDGQSREFAKKYAVFESLTVDVEPYFFPYAYINHEEHNQDIPSGLLEAIAWLMPDFDGTKEAPAAPSASAKKK